MSKIVSGITIAALSLISATTFAATATGQVTKYHLNSGVAGRGACIQMNPAIPTGGWACLYLNNPLYKEINATLLSANMVGKNCSVSWSTTDPNGFAIVSWFECY